MSAVVERLLGEYEGGRMSRRQLVTALTAAALGGAGARGQESEPAIRAKSLNHVTMFVPDVQRSVAFYQDLLGMPVVSRQSNGTNLRAGSGQFLGIFGGDRALIHHFCLGVEDFDPVRIEAALQERGISANVRMRDDATPEVYFQDPAGVRVQLQDVTYCGGSGPLGNDCP